MGFCSFVFNEDSQDTMWTEIRPGPNQKTEPWTSEPAAQVANEAPAEAAR